MATLSASVGALAHDARIVKKIKNEGLEPFEAPEFRYLH